jgi:tetratricopeptide (TPR) repeat protein
VSRKITLSVIAAVIFTIFGQCPAAKAEPHGLRKGELLALVAGDVVSEITIHEIRAGLAFTPDAQYKSLLRSAGAAPAILAALDAAKRSPASANAEPDDPALLAHLSAAGKLIRNHDFESAVNELAASLSGSSGKPEAGFVMGVVLFRQQRWEEMAHVYAELLRQAPDFPEGHTRLGLAYFNMGETEASLREFKTSLAHNPENPTAHLNSGAIFIQLRNLDAAKSELQLALRGKPDYELAYYDLGVAFANQNDFDGAIAQFGPASPYLVRGLTAEAQALRKLGRSNEATQLEKRVQAIQSPSAQANPN